MAEQVDLMNDNRDGLFSKGIQFVIALFLLLTTFYVIAVLFPLQPLSFLLSQSHAQKTKVLVVPNATTVSPVPSFKDRMQYIIIWSLNSAIVDARNNSVTRDNLTTNSTNLTTNGSGPYHLNRTRLIYFFQFPLMRKKDASETVTTTARPKARYLPKRNGRAVSNSDGLFSRNTSKEDRMVLAIFLGVLLSVVVIVYATVVTCLGGFPRNFCHSMKKIFSFGEKRLRKSESHTGLCQA